MSSIGSSRSGRAILPRAAASSCCVRCSHSRKPVRSDGLKISRPSRNCILPFYPKSHSREPLRQLSVAQVRARIGVFEIVSRRNNGPIEEILVGFAELPFWMSAVGAAFVYLFLTFIPPVFSKTSVMGLMFADFFAMLAPWAAAAILLAGLVG